MLNGVNKKKIQKTNNIKVNDYLGTLSKDILDKIDYLLKNKPVHKGTGDIPNNLILLNSVNKVLIK